MSQITWSSSAVERLHDIAEALVNASKNNQSLTLTHDCTGSVETVLNPIQPFDRLGPAYGENVEISIGTSATEGLTIHSNLEMLYGEILSKNNGNPVIQDSNGTSLSVAGAKGIKGENGTVTTGNKGEQGVLGQKGKKGLRSTGLDGDTGEQGTLGPKGYSGGHESGMPLYLGDSAAEVSGTIRYIQEKKKLQVFNGTEWLNIKYI